MYVLMENDERNFSIEHFEMDIQDDVKLEEHGNKERSSESEDVDFSISCI